MDSYPEILLQELSMRRNEIPTPFTTLYLGGGTPSMLADNGLRRLFDGIGNMVGINAGMEITIEANPEDIDKDKIDFYRSIGINRISIGIQSFNDVELQSVSRRHSAASAVSALDALTTSGINYNADLIYGLPRQSLDAWCENLNKLLEYRPPHFSAYLLSYEAGTKLYAQMVAGKVSECDETLAEKMYQVLCDSARSAGYEHYEVSNFALPGKRARHNSAYWDYSPYLGLGPASHSFDGDVRRINPANVGQYIASIKNGVPCFSVEDETEINRFNDYIITSLRTSDGFDPHFAIDKFGQRLAARFAANAESLGNGLLIEMGNGNYRIPPNRWLTSDAIMRDLIVD